MSSLYVRTHVLTMPTVSVDFVERVELKPYIGSTVKMNVNNRGHLEGWSMPERYVDR